jgi:hypothetical protein
MKLKTLAIAAAATFIAVAQGHAQTDPAAQDKLMSIAGQFYMDKEMKTMKSSEEVAAMWAAMSDDDKKMLKDGCANSESIKGSEMCAQVMKM